MTPANGRRSQLQVEELAQSLFLVFGQSGFNISESSMEEVRLGKKNLNSSQVYFLFSVRGT